MQAARSRELLFHSSAVIPRWSREKKKKKEKAEKKEFTLCTFACVHFRVVATMHLRPTLRPCWILCVAATVDAL
jgi:hypothetical protein